MLFFNSRGEHQRIMKVQRGTAQDGVLAPRQKIAQGFSQPVVIRMIEQRAARLWALLRPVESAAARVRRASRDSTRVLDVNDALGANLSATQQIPSQIAGGR